MRTEHRAGRPRASSRETLAEAACELFLEQGYEATSVADITRRAGVSRSSFFNYFASKGDVLWSGLDERIDAFERALGEGSEADAALDALVEGFVPDALALALAHAPAMHLDGELYRDSAVRAARVARILADDEIARGADALTAEVRAAALGGALLAAVKAWATAGPGVEPLSRVFSRARAILRQD